MEARHCVRLNNEQTLPSQFHGTCWFLTDGPPFYSFIWKHPQTGFLAQGQQEGGKTVLILWRSGWFLTSLRFPAKDPS